MFKKTFLLTVFSCLFFIFPVHAEERINNFVSNIKINEDASFHVQEKIEYDFGDAQRHGIYRDIPYKYYNDGGSTYTISLSNFQVIDDTEKNINFVISNSGGKKDIKIGDADILLTGKKTYIIDYDVNHAISYFDDHDELYWNVTGNDWEIPIDNVEIFVELPTSSVLLGSQLACYTGPVGSDQPCIFFEFTSSSTTSTEEITGAIFSSKDLLSNHNMTIVFGFAKGVVVERIPSEFSIWVIILFFLGLPFVTFIIMFLLWYSRGRDKNLHDPIIAQYDAPDNLPPGIVGTIVDEKVDRRDLSSEIIYLAIAGYFKITRLETKKLLFKEVDYQLDKLKEADDKIKDYQKTLLDAFFKDGQSVKLSDLKYTLYKDFKVIYKEMYKFVIDGEFFVKNPFSVRFKYFIVGIVLVMIGTFFTGFSGLFVLTNFLLSGVIIILFGLVMPKRTDKGIKARNYILGLKEYIRVAEKERIKFHNAPEKNPETFEKFLPYAMVFKLEKQWAKQFEGIYLEPPTWYAGSNFATFSALSFVSDLNNFGTVANTTFSQNPSSSSGLGGGGFSGGGFGGGGGGSW